MEMRYILFCRRLKSGCYGGEHASSNPMTTLYTDTVEFTLQNTLRGHSRPINLLAISPDQGRLISVGEFSYFSSIPTCSLRMFIRR